jgi:hypothetical protein
VAIIQAPTSFLNLSDYALVTMLVLYLLLAPAIFFIPLFAAHFAMVASRNGLLKDISTEFNDVFTQMHNLRSEDANQVEPLFNKIQHLNGTHKLIEKFPVWPFNSGSFRKFFGLIFSPLVPAGISVMIDWLSKLL